MIPELSVSFSGMGEAQALLAAYEGKLKASEILDEAATILIGRVRRRYMTQTNPDGSKWVESMAAKKRRAGIPVYAKGGSYAPGGKKVGGNTLFASGNLFHSIQLAGSGIKERQIMTDVEYAEFVHGAAGRLIMGVNDEDMNLMLKAVLKRLGHA